MYGFVADGCNRAHLVSGRFLRHVWEPYK
jgi:hypothetical protein